MTSPKTVLLIGSAPDAVRAKNLCENSYEAIVAINNAWQIRSDWTHGIYPDDLADDRKPIANDGQVLVTSKDFVPANNVHGGIVYAGATMAFTAAYWALEQFKPDRMAFIGCDMIYEHAGGDHFYGQGSADPLRDDPTLQILEAKSNRLMSLAMRNQCACVNLSIKPQSRLTFPRVATGLEASLNFPVLDEAEIDRALDMEQQAGQYFPNGDYWNDTRPLNSRALRAVDEQWMKTVVTSA